MALADDVDAGEDDDDDAGLAGAFASTRLIRHVTHATSLEGSSSPHFGHFTVVTSWRAPDLRREAWMLRAVAAPRDGATTRVGAARRGALRTPAV